MPMNVAEVEYTEYHGGGNIDTWIAEACQAAGSDPTRPPQGY